MEGEWGREWGIETECIQWDVDRVVSGEKGDEMNGDVQWFVCLDRDGESEMEEREGVGTKRRSYNDGQCCVKKSFSAPMLPRNEREGEGRQSVVTSS